MSIGVLGLGIPMAQSQTLLNSWEYSLEGWTISEPGIWSTTGFSTTAGVTAGTYRWNLTAASGPDFGTALLGPSSTALTALLANASSLSVDVLTPVAGSFGNYLLFDLHVVQPGGAGDDSLDGGTYNQNPSIGGPESTLTWTVPQSVRIALQNNPSLPVHLTFQIGGGGGGTMYVDNLRATLLSAVPAQLWVRELWDDIRGEEIPALTAVTDDSSSVGFAATPWIVNPAETNNCRLMAFRGGFWNEPEAGASTMGLPGTLDGSFGCMVQENGGFSFFPGPGGPDFWSDGIFMTRELAPNNYINFLAVGEYWFSMTMANGTNSLDAQYVTFPASGAGGIGFADGPTTNADFVAVGVTGLNLFLGPGETNASKAVYISQGTLGQPGDPYSVSNSPAPTVTYSQTNFTGGPYHVNTFGAQTIGNVSGDGIVVLGHLKTYGNGTATLDAKYYTATGPGNSWNTNLDTSPTGIVWDCSYSFNFDGTMTRMLLFENGQFPFYVFGFRASKNFQDVVGLDPGRIVVASLPNSPSITMTNLAVEASSYSWDSPPSGYGTLNYQWYQNGVAISGATNQYLNIADASPTDPNMPAGTDYGTYTSVATDPSGTWGSVTNSVVISGLPPPPPMVTNVQMSPGQNSILVTFNEPNLTGADATNHYVFSGGVVVTGVTVFNTPSNAEAQILTTPLPVGTRITLTISGITNVVGEALLNPNETFWTDLIQTGAVKWEAWQCAAGESDYNYFNTFLPANPYPVIVQSMTLTSWDGPSSGVTIVGLDGYVGDDFGDKHYGWFIPPVTTNYMFFISCDDGGRLSLSTNSSSTNLFVIACESDWNGRDQWTNAANMYPSGPHRGDGNTNSTVQQSPATACYQNRSDQFIVAYYDSTGLPGGPPGAIDQTNWAEYAESQVWYCVLPGSSFWPNRDVNGQALIRLQAGQMYYMQLEHVQNGGGYDEGVTYKIAGTPDPLSPSSSILTGSNIAGFVPFTPTISIAETANGPQITYTGVLFAGTTPSTITNQVAISSNGPSHYSPPNTGTNLFYRTSE